MSYDIYPTKKTHSSNWAITFLSNWSTTSLSNWSTTSLSHWSTTSLSKWAATSLSNWSTTSLSYWSTTSLSSWAATSLSNWSTTYSYCTCNWTTTRYSKFKPWLFHLFSAQIVVFPLVSKKTPKENKKENFFFGDSNVGQDENKEITFQSLINQMGQVFLSVLHHRKM
jgi:hypothetical protein